MNELVGIPILIVYGWVMFWLGSRKSGHTARVAETPDEDPRPTADGESIPCSVKSSGFESSGLETRRI